jgi:hypothetical protein
VGDNVGAAAVGDGSRPLQHLSASITCLLISSLLYTFLFGSNSIP